MTDVSVRLVQATLLEFFHYYSTLYFQTPFTEIKAQHTVGFQPKSCLDIRGRYGDVIVGQVIGRVGIAFSSGQLHMFVIVFDMSGTAEHQVFE